jgi:phosphoglycerate kinase
MSTAIHNSSSVSALLECLPQLRCRQIQPGERWVYSAGFNVSYPLRDASRIDCELDDLARLSAAGARVAVLAHQGSHRAGTARPLDFVARYMERQLRRTVSYVPDLLGPESLRWVNRLQDGEIALVGNTRLLAGEEAGDPQLAALFAEFGDQVAVGGFSKAHRQHASNVGILRHLPGFAAQSLVEELRALEPWAGTDEGRYSVAVVGGLKIEKLVPGLVDFAHAYDLVIPGGAVLNALLDARGYDVGASEVGECREAAESVVPLLEGECRAEIHLPDEVIVAPAHALDPGSARTVRVEDGVPAGYAIVDFVLGQQTADCLSHLRDGGRAVLAGTPALYSAGFLNATDALLKALSAPGVDTLVLGGDTTSELPWSGRVSTGGGSALVFLATGSCPVLSALTESEQRS